MVGGQSPIVLSDKTSTRVNLPLTPRTFNIFYIYCMIVVVQVDLGGECIIESITVWNRQDAPADRTRPKDTFTSRLVPFWILTSAIPFPQKVNDRRGLAKSLRRANDKKRFTRNRRRTV